MILVNAMLVKDPNPGNRKVPVPLDPDPQHYIKHAIICKHMVKHSLVGLLKGNRQLK